MKAAAITLGFALIAFAAGCSDSGDAITTDMHEDFEHEHEHQHSDGDGHEHEHEDGFSGSHEHGHAHSHRHGEPLHGGEIVSIGHTHHKEGVTHFHAEIMPLTDNTIRFYFQSESDEGMTADYAIEDKEVSALVAEKGREDLSAEYKFTPVEDGSSSAEFSLTLPDEYNETEAFTVLVPRVKLDGLRQNFTFTAKRAANKEQEEVKADTTATAPSAEPGATDE